MKRWPRVFVYSMIRSEGIHPVVYSNGPNQSLSPRAQWSYLHVSDTVELFNYLKYVSLE